tara:strand:- start:1537 stop:3321 length:1785 start_codon:yes stop_codon:yes gene_type:complete
MAVNYKAPINDIIFAYDVLDSYNILNKIEKFKDFGLDTLEPIVEECAKFAEEVLAPINSIGDKNGAIFDEGIVKMPPGFKEAYEKFTKAGWSSISLPSDIGGGGLPYGLSAAILEILCTANMAFVLGPGLSIGAISGINFHANQGQKDMYLPDLVAGNWTGTMNLSEPQSGSDLSNISTKATKQDDGTYRITGTKIWIGSGEHDLSENIIHLVLAKVPGSPEGTKGISMFIVPKFVVNDDSSLGGHNKVNCISIEEKLGIHGSPTCVMEYDGSVGYLIGEENMGLNYMFTTINEARIRAGGHGLACTSGALQGASQYARDRVQGRPVGMTKEEAKDSTIIDHADVRRTLMTIKSYLDAMRYMNYDNHLMLDLEYFAEGELKDFGKERCGILTPITKAWISDLSVELTSMAIQVYGGMGYVEETGIAQYFRDARIAPIYAGTNGIQAEDLVFRKITLNDGKAVESLLKEMRTNISSMKEHENLEPLSEILERHVAEIEEATQYLLKELGKGNLAGVSASGTPYLKMFGQVLGGHYMGKAAVTGTKSLLEDNAEFYNDKITLSKFYIEQLLPLASSYFSSVMLGKENLYSIDSNSF